MMTAPYEYIYIIRALMLFNICKEEATQKQTPLSRAFEVGAAANYEEAGSKAFLLQLQWSAVHPVI